MTRAQSQFGKAQKRFEVRYAFESDAVNSFRTLGSADDRRVADEMAKTWRKREGVWRVWIRDHYTREDITS